MLATKLTKHTPKFDDSGKVKPFHLINNFDKTYTARFSNLFQPIGHNFTASFDVLKTAYWLKYDIIEGFDCLVYDTIHLLCKTKTPFSLEVLAERLRVGDQTLRQSLDNLENAELIEIIQVIDEYGKHNCYLLKTPYFERESIEISSTRNNAQDNATRERRKKFHENNIPIPTEFLEDHLTRLKRQVSKNKIKRLRQFLANQSKTEKHPQYAKSLKDNKKNRFLLWKQVSRTLYDNAASFDEFIYSITPEIAKEQTNADIWSKLREKVKTWCKRFQVKYDDYWFSDIAHKLFEFYRKRLNLPTVKAAVQPERPEPPPAAAPTKPVSIATTGSRAAKQDERENLRKILLEKQAKNSLPQTFGDLRQFVSNISLGALSFDEFLNVVKEFYPSDVWEKLTVELRR